LSKAEKNAFYAYSSGIREVESCIETACRQINTERKRLDVHPWTRNEISGQHIPTVILEKIRETDFFIADITQLNANVTYEIGYAIGIQKRVIITAHRQCEELETAKQIKEVGIFDTIGRSPYYSNAEELVSIVTKDYGLKPINTSYEKNLRRPTYLIEPHEQGKGLRSIISAIKGTRLHYRGFSPVEHGRMSGMEAIEGVSKSYGVVIPWAGEREEKAFIHNIRAAFVCGLAHGMEIPTALLQEKGSGTPPIDLIDEINVYSSREDIQRIVQEWAPQVTNYITESAYTQTRIDGLLSQLELGDPMAENEPDTLQDYYVYGDNYIKVRRGDSGIVVGRKGSGKTALWTQLRNELRSEKNNIILDLKPEGYQLLKLRENILDFLTEGAQAHLITAFWEYILYLEMANKIIEVDAKSYLRDHEIFDTYNSIKDIYNDNEEYAEGDFSERLLRVSNNLAKKFKEQFKDQTDVQLSTPQITELLYSHDIKNLRSNVNEYLRHKNSTWILFDNLDKGWAATGISNEDYIILRCLIDALRKMKNDLRRDGIDFNHVVFIRDDVYQILGEKSPDSGKDTRISLDWSDPELLRKILYERLKHNFEDSKPFEEVWSMIAASHYESYETSQYIIDRSFMRPRNMLKILNHCKGSAINLGHEKIEVEDIQRGMNNYLLDLIIDFDNEISDVIPEANGLIYHFEKEGRFYTEEELFLFMELYGIPKEAHDRIRHYLVYYGIIGIKENQDTDCLQATFIYDVGYNMKRMDALAHKLGKKTIYLLNPAFFSFVKRTDAGEGQMKMALGA